MHLIFVFRLREIFVCQLCNFKFKRAMLFLSHLLALIQASSSYYIMCVAVIKQFIASSQHTHTNQDLIRFFLMQIFAKLYCNAWGSTYYIILWLTEHSRKHSWYSLYSCFNSRCRLKVLQHLYLFELQQLPTKSFPTGYTLTGTNLQCCKDLNVSCFFFFCKLNVSP